MASDLPPHPTTAEAAREWLVWAHAHHHQNGCACHGCIKARHLLRDELPPVEEDSGDENAPVAG